MECMLNVQKYSELLLQQARISVVILKGPRLLMLSHHSFWLSTVPVAAASSVYKSWFTSMDAHCISGRMPRAYIGIASVSS